MLVDKKSATLALAGMMLALGSPAIAQTAAPAAPAAPVVAENAAEPAVDPAAIAALNKMGTALRSMKQFSVVSDATTEIVLDSGYKVQLGSEVTYKVRQPVDLYAEVKSDRRQRQFFYDGKDLTIYSPRLNFYTTIDGVNAPLRELVRNAVDNYGIELPLTDLFFWGTEDAQTDAINGAIHVGPGTLHGERVDQYAFHQDDTEWQVWISQADSLPRKLVITSLDDPARPQYVANLKWDTKASMPAAFSFTPPKGASKIEFVPVAVAVVEEN